MGLVLCYIRRVFAPFLVLFLVTSWNQVIDALAVLAGGAWH